jgi:high-affinity K+ transport system ATPase subunit B
VIGARAWRRVWENLLVPLTTSSQITFGLTLIGMYSALQPVLESRYSSASCGEAYVFCAKHLMHLQTPESAILSAVIFNALIIIALIPLALRGVKYRPMAAAVLLRNNLWIYGVGGIIVPFIGIKIIDILITHMGLA